MCLSLTALLNSLVEVSMESFLDTSIQVNEGRTFFRECSFTDNVKKVLIHGLSWCHF